MAPKQTDLPEMKGPGIELPKDKALDNLGDKFIELRDEKAKLASKLTDLEKRIVERMHEKGLKNYRFGDQEMEVKETKLHIKIKTVQKTKKIDMLNAFLSPPVLS